MAGCLTAFLVVQCPEIPRGYEVAQGYLGWQTKLMDRTNTESASDHSLTGVACLSISLISWA